MRTTQSSSLHLRERRWVKSLVWLFVVAGLVVVEVPASVAKATPKSTILGKTGERPLGIALDAAGNIYTANFKSDNVSKITPAGVSTIIGKTGDGPYGIALDVAGNIYTANADGGNVSRITPAGVSTIIGTTGTAPTGIALDAAGNIYTANFYSDNVSKLLSTNKRASAAKIIITCKKGKVVKKVTGSKPKCPKGYKST